MSLRKARTVLGKEAWITRHSHDSEETFNALSIATSDKVKDPAAWGKEVAEIVDRDVGRAVVRAKAMWTGIPEVDVPWLSRALPWVESGTRIWNFGRGSCQTRACRHLSPSR